ncbi:MAG: hypothetical protein CTY16_06390 [Methylobacter sp.]|uniref:hypothetical protein n=1 Tax=Methylovulum miyakonense TaxID=645578 RepID=UPI0003755DC8|nr:hypothetical protein [Methylovulum miyakonense]PPD47927.1 MAG: hypothetical protein CTY16_06390 [Methylobacter sp.]
MIKHILRLPAYCLGALVLMCVAIVLFAVSDHPDVKLGWSLSHKDVLRAQKILREGSKTKPDEIGTLELSKEDLNLAANYLLNRYSKSAVDISLKDNKLKFIVTATLPENSLGKYLNITLRLGNVDGNPLPTITKFKAGKLLLPSSLASHLIDYGIRHSSLNNYFLLATRQIKAVKIAPEKITLQYFSDMETLIQARQLLTPVSDDTVFNGYQKKLAEVVSQHDHKWLLSLADLLKPLFAMAYQRSNLGNAIEENKIAIFVINDYVNKHQTHRFLSSKTVAGHYYPVYMYKRNDLAQHFIGSAALTASMNGQLSKVVGEEKELSDAEAGSGFSFVDLAADKAGTRFGELATASPEKARKLQKAVSEIKDYRDIMPDPTNLPEHMNASEFKSRYISTSSPIYQDLSEKIDGSIAAIPLYSLD